MKALRYFIGLLVVLAIIVACIWASGGRIFTYLDPASALIMIGVPLVLLKTGWSFRQMGQAIGLALSADAAAAGKAELEDARRFFVSARAYLLGTGALGFFLGVIAMLTNLTDYNLLGRNMAVALISVLYAIFVSLLVCLPMEASLQRKLIRLEK